MEDDRQADMSNWGRCIDLWAPGDKIPSLSHDSRALNTRSGSSMAAAYVAGAAALFLSRYPDARPEQVKRALVDAATPKVVKLKRGSVLRNTTKRLLHIPESWL